MSHILGARLVPNEQVRISPTEIGGIGPKEATQVRYRLGISENIKVNESTKYQIDQIEQIIGQDHVVHWELKRGNKQISNDSFLFLVIMEFVIKMDCPYTVNELIIMLGLVANLE